MTASISQAAAKPGCSNCIMRGLGLCDVLLDLGLDQRFSGEPAALSQQRRPFVARRTIFHRDETVDGISVVCEGWVASTMRLSKGRQQVLSFLLPGEMIACGPLFEPQLRVTIETITPGCYRSFDRMQLRAAMSFSSTIFERILSACNDEKKRADQLILDLGLRTAPERVARLLLDIWDRFKKSNPDKGNGIEFPLRQTHIADATSLTPVYVSKLIGEFHDSGLIEISDRALRIVDVPQLRRLAA